ncbi:10239_t:CDS:2 [Gigaspora margarita]|uniref:10239_t:CDS:1 n=1 Tax=Gigaspora margarita TaxID=4874 RepID=A0ABM8W4P6_GIGMA|nr:10239_t:CDS:2 [Gigaspora margarita]
MDEISLSNNHNKRTSDINQSPFSNDNKSSHESPSDYHQNSLNDDIESSYESLLDDNNKNENNENFHESPLDDNILNRVLNKEICVDYNFIKIMNAFKKYKEENDNDDLVKANIMDLTSKSKFARCIPLKIYKEFLNSLEQYDRLIPVETHNFLVDFFSQDLTYQQWSDAVDKLNVNNYEEATTKLAIKLIIRTFDNFLQAFSLGHMNPLHCMETLEQPYLNDYIHPCIKAAFGKIPSVNHIKHQKGDGVGFTSGSDKYQIVYVEGTRPYKITAEKETQNQCKIANNLKKLWIEIVKNRVINHKVIIPEIEVFGISSFK